MDVAGEPLEISVTVDSLDLIRSLKQVPTPLLLLVDGLGVGDGKGLHYGATDIFTFHVDR